MKKIVFSFIAIALIASVAFAAPRLGTRKMIGEDGSVTETIWADTAISSTTLMNATGAMQAYPTLSWCDKGSMVFDNITGSNIMNVALQVSYAFAPEMDDQIPPSTFYNAIGSSSTPYHQVIPSDTDSLKFDFNSRGFTYWRVNCLAGCNLTNSIGTIYGVCREE